jgi:hypothetical protein
MFGIRPNLYMNTCLKNLFVLYAPGLGGNHISNMLSTDPMFNSRSSPEHYDPNSVNAHHYCLKISPEIIKTHIEELSTQNNILCGHWGNYYWLRQHGLEKHFPNRTILLVTPPKTNTIAFARLVELVTAYTNEYFYKEMSILYTVETMKLLFNEDDFLTIDSELIFQKSINKFIEFASTNYNLTLDVDECKQMHCIWFNNIIHNNTQ